MKSLQMMDPNITEGSLPSSAYEDVALRQRVNFFLQHPEELSKLYDEISCFLLRLSEDPEFRATCDEVEDLTLDFDDNGNEGSKPLPENDLIPVPENFSQVENEILTDFNIGNADPVGLIDELLPNLFENQELKAAEKNQEVETVEEEDSPNDTNEDSVAVPENLQVPEHLESKDAEKNQETELIDLTEDSPNDKNEDSVAVPENLQVPEQLESKDAEKNQEIELIDLTEDSPNDKFYGSLDKVVKRLKEKGDEAGLHVLMKYMKIFSTPPRNGEPEIFADGIRTIWGRPPRQFFLEQLFAYFGICNAEVPKPTSSAPSTSTDTSTSIPMASAPSTSTDTSTSIPMASAPSTSTDTSTSIPTASAPSTSTDTSTSIPTASALPTYSAMPQSSASPTSSASCQSTAALAVKKSPREASSSSGPKEVPQTNTISLTVPKLTAYRDTAPEREESTSSETATSLTRKSVISFAGRPASTMDVAPSKSSPLLRKTYDLRNRSNSVKDKSIDNDNCALSSEKHSYNLRAQKRSVEYTDEKITGDEIKKKKTH